MKEKDFKLTISGSNFKLNRGNVDIYIHRPPFEDVDYLRIFDFDTEVVTNIFRFQEMCRLMAGVAFRENGFPYVVAFQDGQTFKDKFGWFADTYVRDKPSEEAIEGYSMIEAAHDIDEQGAWDFGKV